MSDFNANIILDIDASALDSVEKRLALLDNKSIEINLNIDDKKLQNSLNLAPASGGYVAAGRKIGQQVASGLKTGMQNSKYASWFDAALGRKEVSERNKLYAQDTKNFKKAIESQKRISVQQQIAQMKQAGTSKNSHNNSIVQQTKENMELWKKQYAEIQKIQSSIDSKQYDSAISSLDNKLKNYSESTESYKRVAESIKEVKTAYTELQTTQNAFSSDKSSSNLDNMTKAQDKLSSALKKSQNEMKILSNEQDKLVSSNTKASAQKSFTSYFSTNTKAAEKYRKEIEQLQSELNDMTTVADKMKFDTDFKNLQTKITANGDTGTSLFGNLKNTLSKAIPVFDISQIAKVAVDIGKKMASEVKVVDDALTNLQMATSVTKDEAKDLMKTYSQMGDELKATGTDVAASATEWLKQGKSISESNELAKDSIILSKIGDISSEEATKTITAAMKSYELSTSEVLGFIDQISAIDLVSATDVGGLSEAFNEVAANAKVAGVETETLLSYAAVIGETTQESMASVGTSLNAIFSRMGNIKLSRLKDYETGEDLSNVETVLRGVGIELRDTQDNFREFDDVLDETAAKWDSFSSVTQRAVAKAFAGTHNANEFMVLMEQYSKVEEYTATAEQSSGQSLEKFAAYQESLSGALEGFKNAFQNLSDSTINSGFLTNMVNVGTDALNIVTKLVDKIGVLGTLGVGAGIGALIKNFGNSNEFALHGCESMVA